MGLVAIGWCAKPYWSDFTTSAGDGLIYDAGGGRGQFPISPACSLLAPLANEGIDAMNEFDQTEEEILTYEVSDEALETAAGTGKDMASWTMFCSGISCPG